MFVEILEVSIAHLLHGVEVPDTDAVIQCDGGQVFAAGVQRHGDHAGSVGAHHCGVAPRAHVQDAHVTLKNITLVFDMYSSSHRSVFVLSLHTQAGYPYQQLYPYLHKHHAAPNAYYSINIELQSPSHMLFLSSKSVH